MREVLTPITACMLFGKSGEAVRRAVAKGLVSSPCELRFAPRPIRLIDLEDAIRYWCRGPWPTYQEPLEEQLGRLRLNSIVIAGFNKVKDTGELVDDPLSHFRVLHYEAIISPNLLGKRPDIDFD